MTAADIVFWYGIGAVLSFILNGALLEEVTYRLVGRVLYWPLFLLKFFGRALITAYADFMGDLA